MTAFEPVRIVIAGPEEALEVLSAEFFEAGVLGIVEEPGAIVVYPNSEDETRGFLELAHAFKKDPPCDPWRDTLEVTVQAIDPSWQQTWQKELLPEKISRSFTLRPTHCPLGDDDKEEKTIWFQPDASFGSGGHATTRLAATWIEEFVSAQPDLDIFDVGTGSGVLSLVAARCQVRSAFAVDIDEVAVRSARQNTALNEENDRIRIEQGSADATSETFDLVIANINTPILLELAEQLCARVTTDGKLLLTGLLVEDIPSVEACFGLHGLRLVEQRESEDWALLILTC